MTKKKEFVEGIDYVITIRKRKKFIKNKEEGIKETIYTANETSIIELANEIEEKKYKLSATHGAGYNRNMQTIKACNAYNFMFKPIQNVTRTDIEKFLQAERHKSNSYISKEYSIIKNAFTLAYKKHIIDRDIALDFNIDPVEKPKSEKELYTGMRIGEVLALTTDDFDFDEGNGTIRVNKTITQNKNGKKLLEMLQKLKMEKEITN